jgi:hypothetical protein
VRDRVRREEARLESTEDVRLDEGELAGESWRGNERRYRHDPAYSGPERRMAGL